MVTISNNFFTIWINFIEIKKNSRDYLKVFVHMSFGLLKLRLAKPSLLFTFLVHVLSLGLALFASFSTKNIHFLMRFGPTWGLEIFMFINVLAILERMDVFKDFFTWYGNIGIPYEIMTEKLNRKVKKLSKIAIFTVFVNYGLGILSFIILASSYEYFNEISYLRVWVCTEIPGYCWMKLSILLVFDFISACVMVSSPTAMIYMGITGIFHIMLINDLVKSICSSEIPRKERYNSELYQKLVEQKLKICVMMHDQVIRSSIEGTHIISNYMIPFFLGSIILGVSIMLAMLSAFIEGEYFVLLGFNMYGLCSLMSGSFYIVLGQILKDESELIWYNLQQLPWYYMNKKNIEIYSLLLMKSEKPIALSSNLLEINFLLFVRIFRALYSVGAFVMQMSPSSSNK